MILYHGLFMEIDKPNLQIAFRTDKALTYLHFEGSEQL